MPPTCGIMLNEASLIRDGPGSSASFVACIAGHLRSPDTVENTVSALRKFVLDSDRRRAAVVIATWDVWGMQSPESKVRDCYDTRPLAKWRCPDEVAHCEVLPFAEHQEKLALQHGCAHAGEGCHIRHISQWFIIGRAFSLALRSFRHATQFLRLRPDTALLQPIPVTSLVSSVVSYRNHFNWPGTGNDMVFLARRDGAWAISHRMTHFVDAFNTTDQRGWSAAVQALKLVLPATNGHKMFNALEDLIPLFCSHMNLSFTILNASTRLFYALTMRRVAHCTVTAPRG